MIVIDVVSWVAVTVTIAVNEAVALLFVVCSDCQFSATIQGTHFLRF
jgi:hypothetical protein